VHDFTYEDGKANEVCGKLSANCRAADEDEIQDDKHTAVSRQLYTQFTKTLKR